MVFFFTYIFNTFARFTTHVQCTTTTIIILWYIGRSGFEFPFYTSRLCARARLDATREMGFLLQRAFLYRHVGTIIYVLSLFLFTCVAIELNYTIVTGRAAWCISETSGTSPGRCSSVVYDTCDVPMHREWYTCSIRSMIFGHADIFSNWPPMKGDKDNLFLY